MNGSSANLSLNITKTLKQKCQESNINPYIIQETINSAKHAA